MLSFLLKITSLLILGGLVSCASAPPRPLNPSIACVANAITAQDVQPIIGKIGTGTQATLPMLSDNTRPNPEQQAALLAYDTRNSACIDLGSSWRRQYLPPEDEAVIMRAIRENQASRARLYRGEITFGQYNTHYNAIRADLEQRVNELRAARQQQKDAFQRQQEIARIMAPPPPQLFPVIPPLPIKTSTHTVCSNIGNQVVCNTN